MFKTWAVIGSSLLLAGIGLWSSASTGTSPAPVGLALEVDQGVGVPLRVRAGQEFFIQQIDLRTALEATVDEGVSGLAGQGDFAGLPWSGVFLADSEFVGSPNPDGTWTRRRFYRGARWMTEPSTFVVTPLGVDGRPVANPVVLHVGSESRRSPSDTFFVRRLRAIQWTFDCASPSDCSNAQVFQEEALVELRNALSTARTVRMTPDVDSLQVRWSLRPDRPWTLPVEQVEAPPWDYGFEMDLDALTPPDANGVYAPGSDVTFRLTLRDGSGKPLHPAGSLPTYDEVVFQGHEAGIQYYRAFPFIDPSTTYYRRKHRERMLMVQMLGPAQKIQPLRSIAELESFLSPEPTQVLARPAVDGGVYAEAQLFPPAHLLFGGAFDPTHAGWVAPVSDTFTFHLPADAEPGTYLVTAKGRRTYLGEDVADSTTVEIQVGSPVRTEANLSTGPCNTCHSGGASLSKVLHANDNRAACNGCHVPLAFELEGPIAVRLHFIHSRSAERFGQPLEQCATCHLTSEGIQRTSKAACLSCHTSYPESHVDWFGPVESMYVGGGRESFAQCTDACHTTHPGSGL